MYTVDECSFTMLLMLLMIIYYCKAIHYISLYILHTCFIHTLSHTLTYTHIHSNNYTYFIHTLSHTLTYIVITIHTLCIHYRIHRIWLILYYCIHNIIVYINIIVNIIIQ